jgi:hypothetical protein
MSGRFRELPHQVQRDLIEWYNVLESGLDHEDYERLAELYHAGRFHAWHCPTCGERVRSGEPEDWGHFQGVDQPDHASYPGDPRIYTPETIAKQCDDCRMQGNLHLAGISEAEEY